VRFSEITSENCSKQLSAAYDETIKDIAKVEAEVQANASTNAYASTPDNGNGNG
jgi:hypothetical protein